MSKHKQMDFNIYIGTKNFNEAEKNWHPFALNASFEEAQSYIAGFCDVKVKQLGSKQHPSEWIGHVFYISGEHNGPFGVYWKIEKAD